MGFTLGARVQDELGNHAQQEELDETYCESEACPVVAVLHDLETIAFEVDIAIEIHLVKGLHGNLVRTTILGSIRLLLEIEIEFDWAARKSCLFIAARADEGNDHPPSSQERDVENEGEEEEGLEASTDSPGEPKRHTDKKGD